MADRLSEKRQPWMKWHSQAWRADVPLRMCSYAARGLWADMLSLMHESNDYGFLLIEGVNPTPKQLAGLLGGSEREVKALLLELNNANVYSVTGRSMPEDVEALVPENMAAGVILSRRMLRDKAKADRDRKNGRGGGNPSLNPRHNAGVNPPVIAQRSEVREEMEDRGRPKGLPPEEHQPSPPIAAREGLGGPARDDVAGQIVSIVASRRVSP